MSSIPRLSDDAVAGFGAVATVDWPFLTVADEGAAGEMPSPIRAFLAVRTWHDAAILATSAADGASAVTDAQGFRFRRDGTVVVFDATDDAVVMSRPAFRGLLLRLLDVLVAAATARADPAIEGADWSAVIAGRDRLRGQR